MASILTKPITRLLHSTVVRDGAKMRQLEVTVHPNGTVVLRPKGTRKGGDAEVSIQLSAAYMNALYRRHR